MWLDSENVELKSVDHKRIRKCSLLFTVQLLFYIGHTTTFNDYFTIQLLLHVRKVTSSEVLMILALFKNSELQTAF